MNNKYMVPFVNEDFIDVSEFNGAYKISSYGRLLSLPRGRKNKPTLSIGFTSSNGYLTTRLKHLGHNKTTTIHSLVAREFIDSDYTSKGLFVDHIDRDKFNNKLDNIRLVTRRENNSNNGNPNMLGTTYIKSSGKWQASIRTGSKSTYLGRYNTEQEAHDAYMDELESIMG